MAKDTLISGSMWDEYSNEVVRRMNSPQHQGEITDEQVAENNSKLIVADFGAESCGDAVRLYWSVDESTDTIIDSKFKSFGCGTAIASSDVMAELCIGKTVDEAVQITNIDVEQALRDEPNTPAVPPQKMHCSVMAYDVIKKAAAQYKGVDMESFEKDIMVCECARISLDTIQEVIKINDLTTIQQITDYTKAGAFCKSCIKPGGHEDREYYLENILETVRGEMAVEVAASAPKDFNSLTIVQKIRKIQDLFDSEISAALQSDGGDIELIDLEDHIVKVRLVGACSSCSSSTATLQGFVEARLQDKLSSDLIVEQVYGY
jgi:NifU-like protein